MRTITALDGTSDTTSPAAIRRYDTTASSANVIHELIAPGTIAVTLAGDLPREGTLTLVYTSDADATAARNLLARPTSFALVDPDRPALDMTFVRRGVLSSTIHERVPNLWTLDVGFQEIDPT